MTAIGFHAQHDGAVALKPLGRQANEGLLARLWHRIAGSSQGARAWYQLGRRARDHVLDVGASPGTYVYSPVDGTVAAISAYVINGRQYGSQIDIRPSAAPSRDRLVDPPSRRSESLAVGSAVIARPPSSAPSPMSPPSSARRSRSTRTHAGDNVAIEVHPAAGSLP